MGPSDLSHKSSIDISFSHPRAAQILDEYHWSFEENKIFENALAELAGLDPQEMIEKIAMRLPGKPVEEVEKHYKDLVHDVDMIESGMIPLPPYADDKTAEADQQGMMKPKKAKASTSSSSAEGRSGAIRLPTIRWTDEEHRLFLDGLREHGKGAWKLISQFYVKSRTPSQVLSHARRYFERLNREQNRAAAAAATKSKPSSTQL